MYFMLNPNISDEQCAKLLESHLEHRAKMQQLNLEIMVARMKLDQDLLLMQQRGSRLRNHIKKD